MNISDLAALVSVRNHILVVINDKGVTNREDIQPLNKARVELDKKFVRAVIDGVFEMPVVVPVSEPVVEPVVLEPVVESDSTVVVRVKQEKQLKLPYTEPVYDAKEMQVPSVSYDTKKAEPSSVKAALVGPDPEVVSALEKAKAELKKQGRSNKKAAKSND